MTARSRQKIFEEMSQGILAVMEGRRPESVANPEIYESPDDWPVIR